MSDSEFIYPAGRRLRCQHCRCERFHEKRATLHNDTVFGSLFDLNAIFAHHAAIYACKRCGFVHLFFPDAISTAEESERDREPAEPIDCLSCGQEIDPGLTACPGCGWTWK